MIGTNYILELSANDVRFTINNALNQGVDEYFESILKSLDCSRWDKDHKHRLMQTIGFDYRYMMAQCVILMREFNIASKYLDRLTQLHEANLEYEKENPPIIYDKKKGLKTHKTTNKKSKAPKAPKVSKAEAKLKKTALKLSGLSIKLKPVN